MKVKTLAGKTKYLFAALAAVLVAATLALTGCGASSGSGGAETPEEIGADGVITVAASPTPHAEILNDVVAPLLADEGYTLEVKEFSDYVLPNTATEEGEVDANYFQHQPYLDTFNEEKGTHLVSVADVHFEPYALYSNSLTDLDQLEDGAKIAVPNDTTNEARALLLLEQEGLIKLDPNAGVTATEKDIIENPKNLEIVPVEAATVTRIMDDVDVAAVNGNYALGAGLDPDSALAREADDSVSAQTYPNVLVVREGNENSPAIQALVKAITSDEVRTYLEEKFPGAVIAVF